MKIKIYVVLISILTLAAVVSACSPAAAATAPKPAAQAPAAAVSPAASPTAAPAVQESAPVPAANTSAAAAPGSPSNQVTKISDILANPKVYGGRVVTVSGKIVSECGSGCWFTLQDGNAVIYIDLAPNNMVIPQKKGSTAKVTGEIIREGSDVYMIGSKVDF
jgi:hypothetical protein